MRSGTIINFLLVISVLIPEFGLSQQTPLFAEYNYNPVMVNSAYTGMSEGGVMTLSNYGYINNIEGSPKRLSLSYHSPLAQRKMGLGGAISRDEIGVTSSTNAYLAYSYKLFFDFKSDRPNWQLYNEHVLSFGLTAGIQQYKENLLDLGIVDDPVFSENINESIPTIGIGFLYNRRNFYIGVSAPNILGNKLASSDHIKLSNPVYGYMGYSFLTNKFDRIIIKPNLLLKYEDGAPMQIDINISTSFENKFELGAGYRSTSSLNLMAGVYLFKYLRLIYQYNIGFKKSLLGNSHGIVLSYAFQGYGL
ncbi:PorP/SprF family type IX secretion system membrane protein [Galbibacter sp.]|uniref:PorP/SprF family type IX secretion system membrane protein n=1 Tax=Galbibacter sp. TaxID=2918471 RepID=UPI003A94B715